MKRIILLLMISLVNTSPFYASSYQVTLRVHYLPVSEVRNVNEKAVNAIAERFQETYPHIKLESYSELAVPGLTMDAGPLMAMAGGMAPDVLYVNFRQSETYISQKFLYPLDEYVEQWRKDSTGEFAKAIHPKVLPVINREGHIWAIPFGGVIINTLMYRKDLFLEAGLDPDRPPNTWDEFYEYAQRLTIPEKGQYGYAVASGAAASHWWKEWLWSAGGDIVVQDKDGQWKAVFNDKSGVIALEFYRKLVRGRWTRAGKTYQGVTLRNASPHSDWWRGKIGMIMGGGSTETLMVGIDPNLIGLSVFPKGHKGRRAAEINSQMYGINATIKDPKVRDAAWQYIRFQASTEARKIRTKIFVENGWAKYVNPKNLREFGYESYLKEIPAGWEEIMEEALLYGKPEPYGKNCQFIYNEMDPALEAVALSDTVRAKDALNKAAAHCNEKLMGIIPEDKIGKQRRIAGVVLVVILISFGLLLFKVWKTFGEDVMGKGIAIKSSSEGKLKRLRFALSFIIPAVLAVAIWSYYPLLRGLIMAFQDYKLIAKSSWVGLDNFAEVLFTPLFWKSFLNTFIYASLSLGLGFPVPILLALLLHEVPRGKILYRTLYYLPAATAGIVIYLLWKGFFDPSPAGVMNRLLGFFHIPPQTWLNDPHLAMLCVILPTIWATAGPGCLIYLAALKSIPEELYEAAEMDGAGVFKKAGLIVIPYLKPLLIINFVGAFIGAFRSFDTIFAMTGGGPLYSTHVLGLEIWSNAFLYLRFGYAVSMAWILGSMLVGFTIYQLKILSRLQFKTTGA